MKIKTASEIIDSVVSHIEKQGRAYNITYNDEGDEVENCEYVDSEGKMCAHSFALTEKARNYVKEFSETKGSPSASGVIDRLGDKCHRPSMRGQSTYFWIQIQCLHDDSDYWTEDEEGNVTLSDTGVNKVELLKERYHAN